MSADKCAQKSFKREQIFFWFGFHLCVFLVASIGLGQGNFVDWGQKKRQKGGPGVSLISLHFLSMMQVQSYFMTKPARNKTFCIFQGASQWRTQDFILGRSPSR